MSCEWIVVARKDVRCTTFNPLVSGACLARPTTAAEAEQIIGIFQSPGERGMSCEWDAAWAYVLENFANFQSPGERGMSCEVAALDRDARTLFRFQSPGERGMSCESARKIAAQRLERIFQSPGERGMSCESSQNLDMGY